MRKKIIILLLIIFESTILFGQNECVNRTEIKQLGVEFCLPGTDWNIEPEDKLKFISINRSALYSGTKTYTLRMEKLTEDLSVEQYFDQQLIPNTEYFKEEIVSKGIKEINGKKFRLSKTHTAYTSNNTLRNSYAITYYYFENKIGYALSLVVSDENLDSWNEKEALIIWGSFKINSLPENSVME